MEWTKVSGKRLLQLRGFHSTFILQEKCAQYWPSERSARWETSFFFVCTFSHIFFSSIDISTLWWTRWQSTTCLSTFSGNSRWQRFAYFPFYTFHLWERNEIWNMKMNWERVLISLETEVILKWHPGCWPPLVTRERQETIKDINGFQIPGPGTSNHFGTKIFNGITYILDVHIPLQKSPS